MKYYTVIHNNSKEVLGRVETRSTLNVGNQLRADLNGDGNKERYYVAAVNGIFTKAYVLPMTRTVIGEEPR